MTSSYRLGGILLFLAMILGCNSLGIQLANLLDIQLQLGFYSTSCKSAETIVREEVKKAFDLDNGVAAGLVRMHFHDCFVRGCDGSVLLDSNDTNIAEKDSVANNPSLRGFEVIDNAKARLRTECGQDVVSCADILAFAARDSVVLSLGFGYDVPCGRKDGRVSTAAESLENLPPPFFDLNQLTDRFALKGFSQEEMITLSGAHTIGRSHCTSFMDRLYNFNSTTSQDPSLDAVYADELKLKCPQGSNGTVPINPSSPTTMDTAYYSDIKNNRGLFTSDQTLLSTPASASQVYKNAGILSDWPFKFAAAMVKMGNIPYNGTDGEIRRFCRVINN